MENHLENPAREPVKKLHPLLYRVMVALALWLIFSVWSLSRTRYTDYLLVVVSGLVLFAVLIPAALWWTRRRHRARPADAEDSFRSWRSREFEMWQGRTSGFDAAVEVLLPLAAVSLGMTIFALVAHFSS